MENQSERRKAIQAGKQIRTTSQNLPAGIEDVGNDLMRNILTRLPAVSFASAACVNRSWNSLCNLVLCAPKLSSALSFNDYLEDAVDEVVEKVLSEPIRPHFVLAIIGPSFSLEEAHEILVTHLGSRTPIITKRSEGLMGRDALTNEFLQDLWVITDESDTEDGEPENLVNHGILLTVGFLPGLKTHIVPVFSDDQILVDKFVMDIKACTTAFSDSESPAGILLFADSTLDMNPLLRTIEYSFSPDTIVVGDTGSRFLYSHGVSLNTERTDFPCAVALSFAKDKNKPACIGETKFHLFPSAGLSSVGPTYKAVSVKNYETVICLTASRETMHEQLDGNIILNEIYDMLGDEMQSTLYIGVIKRRNCSLWKDKPKRMRYLEFHEVHGGNEEYLEVAPYGIKTGDPFKFYFVCSKVGLSSAEKATDNLKNLSDKSGVFGGMLFTCCGRGHSYFERRGVDSSVFLENFPEVPFGGSFCAGEIGRADLSMYDEDNDEGKSISCLQHFFSAFYVVMSYSPPPPQG